MEDHTMLTMAEAATRKGAAGPSGPGVRSDLNVVASVEDSGGIRISLTSKVEVMYGASIRRIAARVATTLGVEHARLEIDDKGALPFVIAARVEAAFRRAGVVGRAPLGRTTVIPEPTPRDRPRRSRLYLPGSQPKLFVNAGLHRPDSVILDLEDSVHVGEKDTARLLVRNALDWVDFGDAERMVRVNQLPLGLEDLDEIIPERPHLVLIPKVETPEQVAAVNQRILAISSARQLDHPVWLMPIIESALGVENAFAIATAADTVVALTIGLEDYTADIGVPRTAEGAESLYARTRLVNAAHAAGVQAIDSVFSDVGDMEGLLTWARSARGLGFEGMGCIHPRQIEPIHRGFAPSPAELEKAMRIVSAFGDAQAKGLGVVSLGTKMIDAPVVLRARRIVEQAQAAGLLQDEGGEG